MLQAHNLFIKSFERIGTLDTIYNHLNSGLRIGEEETSDLLRSMIVYAVSALDRLIHDLVKAGLVLSYLGNRTKTPSFLSFGISIEELDSLNTSIIPEQTFENIVVKRHKTYSYQDPDNIAQALSLIWNEQYKWQKIATLMGARDRETKIRLKNIVARRNQIVHEADIDPSTAQVQTIDYTDVRDSVNFIKQMGDVIHQLTITVP